MSLNNGNQWAHTQKALKTFMENLKCNECKIAALEPIRFKQCGHLYCTGCVKSKSQCPVCNAPAKRKEIYRDSIVPKLITYGNVIAQIIKQSQSPIPENTNNQITKTPLKEDDNSLMTPRNQKSINKPNMKGETKLHRACLQGDIDTVRSLLQAGANPNTKDNSDWHPLHEAISYGFIEIGKLLLEAGAIPDIPGNNNRTALHEAVKFNGVEGIKLLLQYNVDANARDSYGKTPLDYAETDEVRKILLDYRLTENELEKTFANISNVTQISNNNFTGNTTCVFGFNLSSESLLLLTKLANQHKIKIAKTFTSAVTHVVTEANDQDIIPVSYEILLAILHGKWILTSKWIRICASLSDLTEMELETFEVQGTISAPRSNTFTRARENEQKQNPRLFNNCNFFFAMNHQSTYSLGQLEFTKAKLAKLIKEGKGKVLSREPNPELVQMHIEIPFHVSRDLTHPLHRCSHYIIYVPGQDEPPMKYNMPHIKSLPLLWLIESIEQFELLNPAYIGINA